MRKSLYCWASVLLLCAIVLPVWPADGAEPASVGNLNGYVWMDSSDMEKLSFLLGVESAIAMEMALAEEEQKALGTPVPLSAFQEGWLTAFANTPRQIIAERVTRFYTFEPSQKKRHVFDVIWTEMIVPALPDRR